jgi:putative methionine-R-sulfoxide reductase with GAF domain
VRADVKPTATTTREKPVLDRESFQQLLAAAYVLQEQNDRLPAKAPRPDYTQALSEFVEIQSLIQSHQLDLQSAASLIARRAEKFTGASGAAVGILKDDEVTYQSATGIAADDSGMPIAAASSISAYCFSSGETIQSPDAQKDPRLPAGVCHAGGIQSLIAVPARHGGTVAGVLELRFSEKNAFQEQDVRICQLMAGLWAEAIARTAELEWKQALASERATMIEALERIKPQLERIAVDPSKAAAVAPVESKPTTSAVPEPDVTGTEKDEEDGAEVVCRGCGHHLENEEFYCGICGAPRPSEDPTSGDLQSKWASLWHLKQAADIRKSAASEEMDEIDEEVESPALPLPLESDSPDLDFLEASVEPTDGEIANAAVRILPAGDEATEKSSLPTVSASPWTSASRARAWLESFNTPRKRLWLAKHRANLYLATAAVLLVVVIAGWGSHSTPDGTSTAKSGHPRTPPPPQLTLFEKTLVELGLAVPPPSAVYKGNPDIKVWEDERTALYYCPGADLYGKTERGKFSSQRDAQLDQFEPAFRRPCQ